MHPRTLAYVIAGTVFVLDRVTKYLIETRMSLVDVYTVIPGFFDIVHSKNSGAAFGFLSGAPAGLRFGLLIGLSTAALVFIATMLWRAAQLDRPTVIALALIFGGAMGNVYDRVLTGTVTDFLDFYVGSLHWPAFNVADSAIVAGSGLLLLGMFRTKREPGTRPHVS